MQLLVTKRRKI